MLRIIMNGFPLRRCSWLFNPIVPVALSREMFRWLDLVCLAPVKKTPRFSLETITDRTQGRQPL